MAENNDNEAGGRDGDAAEPDDAPRSGPIHDQFFRRLMAEPATMRTFLAERLPPEVAGLLSPDLPRLVPGSFVDETLGEHFTDLIYKLRLVTGAEALIYTLIDHKSAPDPATPLQLGRYMMLLWNRLVREGGAWPLPRILPLIVYHGVRPWTVPTRFAGLFDKAPDAFAPYLPDFAYHLVDLSDIDDDALSGDRRLKAFLTVLKHIQRPDFLDHAGAILSEMGFLETVDIITILSYIIMRWRKRIDTKTIEGYVERIDDKRKETVMGDVIDTWIAQGRAEGVAKGRAEGVAEGRAEGVAEGRTDMLRRLLTRRFGPLPKAVEERIASANIDALDRWFDRAIDVPSLDAIFDASSKH